MGILMCHGLTIGALPFRLHPLHIRGTHNWADDEISLIVATSAFGLGVNKPNDRFVFHVGVLPSVEAWVQEAGRGGRDGNQCTGSYCINCDLHP